MNVVDSSGWLEYFADEPNADFFAKPILDVGGLIVPTITILEVFKRTLQQRDEEAALKAVGHMEQGKVVGLDQELAISAAILGTKMRLPLADSIILATARRYGATLWTMDKDFEGIDGVQYCPHC
jgi:predicted nucleic acid-binding protein